MRVERDGAVAVWTLTRPHVKNALDHTTLAAMASALAAARSDRSLRAVVLTADGDSFASGGDLRELRSSVTRAQGVRIAEAGRRVCDGILRLPIPVVAALPGPALGGGAELALACDIRVAERQATLGFRHARMAVTTAWGTLPKLVATVGAGAAARLLLAGHDVGAEEALRLGLVDAVTDPGEGLITAKSWAFDAALLAPLAVSGLKRLLGDALGPRARSRALERRLFEATWTSADHREAVEAFFERRAPAWRMR
ncbi:MAG TPA: enoyl-CoA hydratase/isomerase family protein [Polyangiaceae bacterium]|nr:enoyl-CoA hydratase/isomerase family protein [Polyangiaceae bacterium]